MRKWTTWGAIAVIVVFAGFMAGRLGLGETIPESPLIGSP